MRFIRFSICALIVVSGLPATGLAALEFATPDVIGVETRCLADSVTVGQRFVVTHTFSYADTLSMLPVVGIKVGKNRVISLDWRDHSSDGMVTRTARLELMSLDLSEARLPQQEFDFETPAGDTLRAITDEIVLPVRSLTATSQMPRPLKEQWEAPRNWTPWFVAAITALLAAATALFIWRRRLRRESEPVFVPSLPPDFVALTELTRIEQMGLVDRGEFKRYYTLVVDAMRHYVEARFRVEAMDRTTFELLSDLDRNSVRVDGLGPLLDEADLVKFARHVPRSSDAEHMMHASREIVIATTPRHVNAESTGEEVAARGEGAS